MLQRIRLSPIQRAAVTSATVMCAGDLCCQAIQQRTLPVQSRKLDIGRACRFGLIGLTLHGPFFFKGFSMLDQHFGSQKSLKNAIIKTATGQVTLFPIYTTALFMYLGLLEGKGLQQSWQRLQQTFPKTYATGSVFWPTVNIFNFMYIPPTHRILYVNAMGLIWNTFLSWVATNEPTLQPQTPIKLSI